MISFRGAPFGQSALHLCLGLFAVWRRERGEDEGPARSDLDQFHRCRGVVVTATERVMKGKVAAMSAGTRSRHV